MRDSNINKLQQKDAEINRLREELASVKSSSAWLLTTPMRSACKKINRARTIFREWLSDRREPIRRLYFTLPLPVNFKTKMADIIDKKLGNRNIEVKGRYENMAAKAGTLLELIKTGSPLPKIKFPPSTDPEVSIIIPVYNNAAYTYTCLTSILENTSSLPYEVIIVDDNSSDDTENISKKVQGIKYLKNDENLGFIRSCNKGADSASGKFLVFLNNDTFVTEGWLDELTSVFRCQPDAGLVGAKLIYPDGRLQEAGGIVWRDGAAWNYGNGDDPAKPQYNYLREVDYCSAACIAIAKEFFRELGGFDIEYEPAYFEDTDIAFRVREAGKKVFYQPLSKVIHFEGITSGKDTNYGIKSYQVTNQSKFYERWEQLLKKHRPYNTLLEREKERNVSKYALFIDATTVTPDQDAGSTIVFNYMRIFQYLGYKVTFAPSHLSYDDKYSPDLQRIGIECLYTPYVESLKTHLNKSGKQYDVVFLARADVADQHINSVKRYCPGAFVIFDTEDLHYLREMREAALRMAEQRKEQELSIMSKADLTIVTSSFENEILKNELAGRKIEHIHPPWEVPGLGKGFNDRNDIAFIGSYNHPPNVDAVKYFVREIFPRIKEHLPRLCFYVIGSNPPKEILDISSKDIVVVGHVKDLGTYLNSIRLTIAPMRFGAGVKGKIITSLGYGVPVVSTSLGVEGMGLAHEEEVLVSDEPAQFASSVARLYSDKELWDKLSERGLKKIMNNYSLDHARRILENHIGQNFKTR